MNAILTYHSIDESASPISVSPAAFRRHLGHLRASGTRIVTIEELLTGCTRDQDAVALTFDDGYATVESEAAPVLLEHGVPATIFVVSDCAGATNRWALRDGYGAPERPLLGWDAIGRLEAHGLSIGSHTHTHPNLTDLSTSRVEEEIGTAASELARRLGRAPVGFAYPYGATTAAVRAAVGRTHQYACATAFRTLDSDHPFDLPRVDMWYFGQPGIFETWGTRAFARWVTRRHRLRQVRAAWRRMAGS